MAKRKKKEPAGLWEYEHRADQIAPRSVFLKRIIGALLVAFGLIVIALTIGIVGYHLLAGLGWIDSLLEASMILGGMGPVRELHTDSAKIFASIYALFSGIIFIALMGIMLAPVAHRLMHKFHVDEDDVK
ncbi:MAG TPA: hypothetical protein VJT71_17895 [Pyrinomonadaceae bacterium]|nr:hypothetical protein [Pyrinomonadaceae bacterium]